MMLKVISTLTLGAALLLWSATGASAKWIPPIGIPRPSFGIEETAPARPDPWTSEVAGYGYVDVTAPGCTDSNAFGWPATPRCSIPASLSAGNVFEVHGGLYTGSTNTITFNCTAANPCWIRGQNAQTKPTYQQLLSLHGSYGIIENIDFRGSTASANHGNIDIKPPAGSTADHIAIRHCTMIGTGTNFGNNSVVSIEGNSATEKVQHIVVYDCEIASFGEKNAASENDFHGVHPQDFTDQIWIVDSNIHDMAGDSVQVGSATVSNAARPTNIYIGRNHFHANRENAVDVKNSQDVIVSQNDMHNFRATGSSSGTIATAHNGVDFVWFINNKVYDGEIGLKQTGGTNTYFIGNLIYDIHARAAAPTTENAGVVFRGGGTLVVVNNTIYDIDTGLQNTGSSGIIKAANNIITKILTSNTSMRHVYIQSSAVADNSDMTHSIINEAGGDERIQWGDGTSRTVAGWREGYPAEGLGVIAKDPLFVNAVGADFHLQAASPAIDAGAENAFAAYTDFSTRYARSILFDFDGNPRPVDGNASGTAEYDIGGYERRGDAVPPSAPTNLIVQ